MGDASIHRPPAMDDEQHIIESEGFRVNSFADYEKQYFERVAVDAKEELAGKIEAIDASLRELHSRLDEIGSKKQRTDTGSVTGKSSLSEKREIEKQISVFQRNRGAIVVRLKAFDKPAADEHEKARTLKGARAVLSDLTFSGALDHAKSMGDASHAPARSLGDVDVDICKAPEEDFDLDSGSDVEYSSTENRPRKGPNLPAPAPKAPRVIDDSNFMDHYLRGESRPAGLPTPGPEGSSSDDSVDILDESQAAYDEEEDMEEDGGGGGKEAYALDVDRSDDVRVDSTLVIPGGIHQRMFPYQRTAVRWLWELHKQNVGGIMADEMGLGKTIQVIGFLGALHHSGVLGGCVLLVCPATLMSQWVRELHTWYPAFRVIIARGGGDVGQKIDYAARNSNVVITSYESLRLNIATYVQYPWAYYILDEGHRIRNPEADVSVSVKRVRCPHRIILTGAPIQNKLDELWSLFDFVFPGRLGTLPLFQAQFGVPIQMGAGSRANSLRAQTAYNCAIVLRDLIRPYFLRRLKSVVGDRLPSKQEEVVFCNLTPVQREYYKVFLKTPEVADIYKRRRRSKGQTYACINMLRKICNHPDLFLARKIADEQETRSFLERDEANLHDGTLAFRGEAPKRGPGTLDVTTGALMQLRSKQSENSSEDPLPAKNGIDDFGAYWRSGKLIVLAKLMLFWRRTGHRVLLFSQSRVMISITESLLVSKGYTYRRMDGTTNVKMRLPLIDEYNSDPSIFAFLLTTRVGGLGVNLTGADRVVIIDPDWNPCTDQQARERAWRIGQQREVKVFRLILAGTIEERIYERQLSKTFLSNRILRDPSSSLESLSSAVRGELSRASHNMTHVAGLFTLTDESSARRIGDKAVFAAEKRKVVKTLQRASGRPVVEDDSNGFLLRGMLGADNVRDVVSHDSIVDAQPRLTTAASVEAKRIARLAAQELEKDHRRASGSETGRPSQGGTLFGTVVSSVHTGRGQIRGGEGYGTAVRPSAVEESASLGFFGGRASGAPGQIAVGGGSVAPSSVILKNLEERQVAGLDMGSAAAKRPRLADVRASSVSHAAGVAGRLRVFLLGQPGHSATTASLAEHFQEGLHGTVDASLFREVLRSVAVFSRNRETYAGSWKLRSKFLD